MWRACPHTRPGTGSHHARPCVTTGGDSTGDGCRSGELQRRRRWILGRWRGASRRRGSRGGIWDGRGASWRQGRGRGCGGRGATAASRRQGRTWGLAAKVVNCRGSERAGTARGGGPGGGAEEGPWMRLFARLEGSDHGWERWTGGQDPDPGGAYVRSGAGERRRQRRNQ